MTPLKSLITAALTLAAVSLLPYTAHAKLEKWQDTEGKSFKAEPAEIFGPFALFKTGKYSGRRLPLQYLSEADCIRFYSSTEKSPPLAQDWSKSDSIVRKDLTKAVLKLEGDTLVPATLEGRPEPHFIVVVYCYHGEGKSWETLDAAQAAAPKIQQAYPGQVEFLYFGIKHSQKDDKNMITAKRVSWLIADYEETRSMTFLPRMAPMDNGYGLLLINAAGVPILQESPNNAAERDGFFRNVSAFLSLGNPANPESWQGRAHYLRALASTLHKDDAVGAELIGNPLNLETLKKIGIKELKAELSLDAEGVVQAVNLNPEGIPPELIEPLKQALKQSVLIPAVDHGKRIPSVFQLSLQP